ncbi:MAG: XRE family transcriptional regulator [Cytophagales bacterium]|nr:MAG: XRE family transcriptional regulator [Cytophagales bacterium]TAF60828.1 MAG: XRE family transcriptional regulator [Cytophagales bacterium]
MDKTFLLNKIKELRKQKKITQKQLAQKLEVSTPYVTIIEKGKTLPSYEQLERIFIALDERIEDYLQYSHTDKEQLLILLSELESVVSRIRSLLNK